MAFTNNPQLEHELDKMHQIKRENIHVFVNDARHQIQTLWDQLYMSAEERNYFQAIYSGMLTLLRDTSDVD